MAKKKQHESVASHISHLLHPSRDQDESAELEEVQSEMPMDDAPAVKNQKPSLNGKHHHKKFDKFKRGN